MSQAVEHGVSLLLADANVSTITLSTALGSLTAVQLPRSSRLSLPLRSGATISIPVAVQQAFPNGAVLAVLSISGGTGDPFAGLASLASGTLEISIFNGDGERLDANRLPEPILFRLPPLQSAPPRDAELKCVFLEAGRWSSHGVRMASSSEVAVAGEVEEGVWCLSTHLSIFAAILLGCTNLELFSAEGRKAVVENEGWHETDSAGVVFFAWSLLGLTVIIGVLREQWALRLGRTHSEGKSVSLCRKFLSVGPQLLKHKYTAFLVYAKDLVRCLTTGRAQLKNATLTASVQRFLAVREGVAVATVTAHCWNGAGWIDSAASLPKSVLCSKLDMHSGTAEEVIERDIFAPGFLGMLRRFCMLAVALHPMLDALRMGAGSLTVAKRVTLQTVGICGVLATNALIFNFSGDMRSWEAEAECPITAASQLFIIVATSASILINALPNAFLLDLAKQVHGRPLWNVAFWFVTLLYLTFAVFLVILALSNLNPKDQGKLYKSLEWGLTLKLIGMPFAQAVRNSVLLEIFLRDDRSAEPSKRFRVLMGLEHHNEAALSEEEVLAADKIAKRAISAEELVRFTALLGEKVMLDFNPETTSDEVVHRAVELLSVRPPPLEDYLVHIHVSEAHGLLHSPPKLLCSVLHLGKLTHRERVCLAEHRSEFAVLKRTSCRWHFQASIPALDADHALGFVLAEPCGRNVGMAWLNMEEVLEDGCWSGDLPLHPISGEGNILEHFVAPTEIPPMPALDMAGSTGVSPTPIRRCLAGKLSVKVQLPPGYWEALVLHDVWKQELPRHESEADLGLQLPGEAPLWGNVTTSTLAFCRAKTYKEERLPPERMVVHSRQGKFLHMVTTVLEDALAGAAMYDEVHEMIVSRDFFALLDLLHTEDAAGMRYWIDMFAFPSRLLRDNPDGWHEGFLTAWPCILRTMRRAACDRAVADIRARKDQRSPQPLTQLLILDANCHFMREAGCLAELMLAKGLRVRQRLVLHNSHLQGSSLGDELRRLSEELALAYKSQEIAYTTPYLEDGQAVYDAVRDLVIKGVKEQRDDRESTFQELSLTDVYASIGAVMAARSTENSRKAAIADKMDLDDLGGGADMDA